MAEQPDLTIAVLHYNRWDLTKDCLASIDAQEIPCAYEKVLVDNGSAIHLLPSELPSGWRLVSAQANRGHIVGQNRCFESAHGEWVLFVANDVRMYPTCLDALWWAATLSRDREVFPTPIAQLQPICRTPQGTVDHAGMSWRWPGYGLSLRRLPTGQPGNPLWQTVPIIPSTCYLMRKAVWHSVGGFDDTLSASHEDVDMGLRAAKQGFHNICVGDAAVVHLGNATLKHTLPHPKQAFHQDRLRVLRKHYRWVDYWTRYLAVQLLDHLPRPHPRHQRSA